MLPGQSYPNELTATLSKTIEGNYYVIVITNVNGFPREDNFENNIGISDNTVEIELTPVPDLRVKNIIPPGVDNIVLAGSEESLSWTVINQGEGPTVSGEWFDRVSLSRDSNFITGPSIGTFRHEGNLSTNEEYDNQTVFTIPENIDGDYFIFVETDYSNREFEFNFEFNNVSRIGPIRVIGTPKPDLIIEAVSAPAEASNNEQVVISWQGRNIGALNDRRWTDQVLISDAPDLSGNFIRFLGFASYNDTIGTDETYELETTVALPAKISGDYYILVLADGFKSIDEGENEDNNVLSSSVIKIASPDIQPKDLSMPSQAFSGSTIDISWNLTNNGPGDLLGQYLREYIYLSPTPEFNQQTAQFFGSTSDYLTLFNGNSTLRQGQITIPDGVTGTFYVIVASNPAQSIFENGQTANNTIISAEPVVIEAPDYPDLEGVSISFDSTTITAGNSLSLSYTIRNNGPGEALGSWRDALIISNSPDLNSGNAFTLSTINHSQLVGVAGEYQEEVSIQVPGYFQEGTYYFHLISDRNGQLFESNEDNNILSSTDSLTVVRYPFVDLGIFNVRGPDVIQPGTPFGISWSVRNNGEVTTLADTWQDGLYLSRDRNWDAGEDILLAEWTRNGALSVGQQYSRLESVTIPPDFTGNFFLILVTDHQMGTLDNTRFNNTVVLTPPGDDQEDPIIIEFPPPTDLVLTELNVEGSPVAGQPLRVSFTVENQGESDLIGRSWTDGIYLSANEQFDLGDRLLSSKNYFDSLLVGQRYSDTIEVTLPTDASGNFAILVKTDSRNRIRTESDENNNVQTFLIDIIQPPPGDLVVTEITNPLSGQIGEEITVAWTVRNLGQNPIQGRMSEGVYLSLDEVWDASDVQLGSRTSFVNIPSGGSTEHSLNGSLRQLTMDDYYVLVKTDLLNNFPEGEETNNESVGDQLLSVQVPELVINIAEDTILESGIPLYYRIEVPSTLAGESMLVSLLDGKDGNVNELYLSYGAIPTQADHEFSVREPFAMPPSLTVPSLQTGTYYLLAYTNIGPDDAQSISLLAEILDFELTGVNADEGGNTGQVTVKLSGSKFVAGMGVTLRNAGGERIKATRLDVIDPTTAFVSLNLNGALVGYYDVLAINLQQDTAVLENGFRVVEGTVGNSPLSLSCSIGEGSNTIVLNGVDPLGFEVQHPPTARANRIVPITFRMENTGNIDIPIPKRLITSLGGAPLASSPEGLSESLVDLYLSFAEKDGPERVLRPGAVVYQTIYTKAVAEMRFSLF